MEARSTHRKTFELRENGKCIGELVYEDMFHLKAEINLTSSEVYQIKPAGFFGTSIAVTKNGIEILYLHMNWRGQIVLDFKNNDQFLLKPTGVLQNKYCIENSDAKRLIEYAPDFNWSRFTYNYQITCDDRFQNNLLILLGVYACNYYIASASGAFAGIA